MDTIGQRIAQMTIRELHIAQAVRSESQSDWWRYQSQVLAGVDTTRSRHAMDVSLKRAREAEQSWSEAFAIQD